MATERYDEETYDGGDDDDAHKRRLERRDMELIESRTKSLSRYERTLREKRLFVVGPRVHDYVFKRSRFPHTVEPFVHRYNELVIDDNSCDVYTSHRRLYTDLLMTVLNAQLRYTDFHVIDGPAKPEYYATDEYAGLRTAHVIVAKSAVHKLLRCSLEAMYGATFDDLSLQKSVRDLYDNLLPSFIADNVVTDPVDGTRSKRVPTLDVAAAVTSIARQWLRQAIAVACPTAVSHLPEPIGDEPSFLGNGHIYWLWLHMTAARVDRTAVDFASLLYKFDFLLYCGHCSEHFRDNVGPFFRRDTDGGVYTDYSPRELVYSLHLLVSRRNATTAGRPTHEAHVDRAILDDYNDFWSAASGSGAASCRRPNVHGDNFATYRVDGGIASHAGRVPVDQRTGR